MNKKKHFITKIDIFSYGFLALPIAFAGFPLYILAPDFYAINHDVSLATLGVALLILRLFDAAQDPFIGIVIDKYNNYLIAIIITAVIFLCLSIYNLFNEIYISAIFWFSLNIVIAVSCYSVVIVGLNSRGALWSKNKHNQTRIAGGREAFGLMGLVLAITLPTVLSSYFNKEDAYQYFCYILFFLSFISLIFFSKWYKKHNKQKKHKAVNIPIIKSLKVFLTNINPQISKILPVYFISAFASTIPAVLVIFFVRSVLNLEEYIGLFLLVYFVSGAIFMPLWKNLSTKIGKSKSWSYSMILSSLSFIWASFLGEGDLIEYMLICLFSGMALGADLSLPYAILAEYINEYQISHHSSSYHALFSFLTKTALAIASAVSFLLLDIFGFNPSGGSDKLALMGLAISYAIIPCMLKLLAYLMLRKRCDV